MVFISSVFASVHLVFFFFFPLRISPTVEVYTHNKTNNTLQGLSLTHNTSNSGITAPSEGVCSHSKVEDDLFFAEYRGSLKGGTLLRTLQGPFSSLGRARFLPDSSRQKPGCRVPRPGEAALPGRASVGGRYPEPGRKTQGDQRLGQPASPLLRQRLPSRASVGGRHPEPGRNNQGDQRLG